MEVGTLSSSTMMNVREVGLVEGDMIRHAGMAFCLTMLEEAVPEVVDKKEAPRRCSVVGCF